MSVETEAILSDSLIEELEVELKHPETEVSSSENEQGWTIDDSLEVVKMLKEHIPKIQPAGEYRGRGFEFIDIVGGVATRSALSQRPYGMPVHTRQNPLNAFRPQHLPRF